MWCELYGTWKHVDCACGLWTHIPTRFSEKKNEVSSLKCSFFVCSSQTEAQGRCYEATILLGLVSLDGRRNEDNSTKPNSQSAWLGFSSMCSRGQDHSRKSKFFQHNRCMHVRSQFSFVMVSGFPIMLTCGDKIIGGWCRNMSGPFRRNVP